MTFVARRRYRWRMTKITTKADLLNAMSVYDACVDATEYVADQPDDATAAEIWFGCANPDWLIWFVAHHRPAALRPFAFACADRAVRIYAAGELAGVGLGDEARVLRALAPIVDAETAYAGEAAARAAARPARAAARAATRCASYACAAARAAASADAAYAAAYADAYADAADAAATARVYAAAAARAYAARADAAAAAAAELQIQLAELHALADAVLVGA